MIRLENDNTINIYTKQGCLKSTIEVPEGSAVVTMAYHHIIWNVIVPVYDAGQDSYFLLRHSAKGKLKNSMFFCKRKSHVFS